MLFSFSDHPRQGSLYETKRENSQNQRTILFLSLSVLSIDILFEVMAASMEEFEPCSCLSFRWSLRRSLLDMETLKKKNFDRRNNLEVATDNQDRKQTV